MKISRKRKREIIELVRTRRYEQALRICQQIRREAAAKGEVDRVPSEVLYYGCCALFGLDHIQQAAEWVDAHGRVTNYSPANLYLEGFLRLHERSIDEALGCWTGIVQSDPAETLADVLIERIKSEEERTLNELEAVPAIFEQFVPLPWTAESAYRPRRSFFKPGKPRTRGAAGGDPTAERPARKRRASGALAEAWNLPGVKPALAGILVLGLVAAGIAYFEPGALRPGNWGRVLEERLPETPSGGSVVPAAGLGEEIRFEYPDRDGVIAEYRRARELAVQGRVNQARFLLGKIELSNATFEIKERALLLRDSLPYMNREHFEDAITPAQVAASPYMLRGSQIYWRGRANDLTPAEKSLRFVLGQAGSVTPPANPSIPAALPPASPPAEGEPVAGDRPAKLRVTVQFQPTGGTLPELIPGQAVRVFGVLEESTSAHLTVRASEVLPE